MRKKKIHVVRYLVFLMLAGIAVTAYFYSAEGYSFFMRAYYEKALGLTVEQQVEAAEKLLAEGRYAELKKYLHPRILVYPGVMPFRKLDGLARIRLGEPAQGIDSFLTAAGTERIPEQELEESTGRLMEMRRYGDIIELLAGNDPGDNPDLLYRYGVALFETGDAAGAVKKLKAAIDEGRTDYEAYHYLGRAYAKTGNMRLALPHLEHAHNLNEDDPEVAVSLAAAYRHFGRYEESARLLRTVRR